jgi:hypothetical protein
MDATLTIEEARQVDKLYVKVSQSVSSSMGIRLAT